MIGYGDTSTVPIFTLTCIMTWIDLNLSIFLSVAVTFTDGEKEQMRKFTNRSYVLDKTTRYHVWLSLVDVILAYVYDVRTTEGEHNVSAAFVSLYGVMPSWFGGMLLKIKTMPKEAFRVVGDPGLRRRGDRTPRSWHESTTASRKKQTLRSIWTNFGKIINKETQYAMEKL